MWVVSWIRDKTGNASITHTHPQRQGDKDREGQRVCSLLNLGVITGWGGRRIFSMKTILQSSCCQQQQFSPSELIGVSVAVLCRWAEAKTKREGKKEKQQRETTQEQTWRQRMWLFCHSRRVRYNQTTQRFRAKVLIPKSERGNSAGASGISYAGQVLIFYMPCYILQPLQCRILKQIYNKKYNSFLQETAACFYQRALSLFVRRHSSVLSPFQNENGTSVVIKMQNPLWQKRLLLIPLRFHPLRAIYWRFKQWKENGRKKLVAKWE